jgi:hypothetical protein
LREKFERPHELSGEESQQIKRRDKQHHDHDRALRQMSKRLTTDPGAPRKCRIE